MNLLIFSWLCVVSCGPKNRQKTKWIFQRHFVGKAANLNAVHSLTSGAKIFLAVGKSVAILHGRYGLNF